jgi:hypothetical protein
VHLLESTIRECCVKKYEYYSAFGKLLCTYTGVGSDVNARVYRPDLV